jgi:hypothetical protein
MSDSTTEKKDNEKIPEKSDGFRGVIFAVGSCLLVFAAGLLTGCGNSLFAQQVSIDDIVAGYRANASLFQGSRVFYQQNVKDRRWEDCYTFEGVYDYWCNGQDVLLRGGDSEKISGVEKILSGQFPDNITSLDLQTLYAEIPVISYDSKEKLGYRWAVYVNSSGPNDRHYGTIAENTLPLTGHDPFLCPPFLPLPVEVEGRAKEVFPADAFFSSSASDLHLLGTQIIDGIEYHVVESHVMSPEGYYQFQEEGMNFCTIHRAWIDIKRGCIPIRIEYLSTLSKDEQLVEHDRDGRIVDYVPSLQFSESSRTVFEVQEIQKYGIGFYPVKSSLRLMGMSKEAIIQLQKILNEANANNEADTDGDLLSDVDFSLVVLSENRWDVTCVLLNVVIDRETIVLPFPKGTLIFDDRTEYVRFAGMPDNYILRAFWVLRIPLLFIGIGMVLGMVIFCFTLRSMLARFLVH